MRDESTEKNDKNVAAGLEYFADRSNLLFSYHFVIFEFQDDEDFRREAHENHRSWLLKTIQNACLHTSLIALRDLEDFFTPRKNNYRPNDLKACDFGMEKNLGFLSKEERNEINKLIAHTTKDGLAKVGHQWDLLELISKAVAQCDAFLDWIKETYSLDHFHTWTAAAATQTKTKAILKTIKHDLKFIK